MRKLLVSTLVLAVTAAAAPVLAQGQGGAPGVRWGAPTSVTTTTTTAPGVPVPPSTVSTPNWVAAPLPATPMPPAPQPHALGGIPMEVRQPDRPVHPGGPRWGGKIGGHWWGGMQAPGGWHAYRRPVHGDVLPGYWFSPSFAIFDFADFGLEPPPYGYHWSRYYDDAVLIDDYGRVIDSVHGLDWDRPDRVAVHGSDGYDSRIDDYERSFRSDARDYPPPPPPPGPVIVQQPGGGYTQTWTAGSGYVAGGYWYPPATVTTVTVQPTVVTTTTTTTEYVETRYRARRAYHAPRRRVTRCCCCCR